MAEERNIEGLSGWLIFVGFGIITAPLSIITRIFPVYLEILVNGSWTVLTTPGTRGYEPFIAALLFGEVSITTGLFFAWVFIAFLFFSKKRLFPKCYISILLFSFAFVLLEGIAVKYALSDKLIYKAEIAKNLAYSFALSLGSSLAHSLGSILIWVPYMLVSKRVKATFIK